MGLLRSVHAWCGIVLSLFLALIGLTGALSTLHGNLTRLTVPAARSAPPPAASFGPALERFDAQGAGKIQSVKFAPYDLGVHRLYLRGGRGAFIDRDGRIVERLGGRRRIQDLAFALHPDFLLGAPGLRVVGIVALGGLGMVLSGLVIWAWPRPRFSLRIWPRSLERRQTLPAHQTLGYLLAPFLLVQLATGAGMALDPLIRPLLHAQAPAPPKAVAAAAGQVPWTRLLAAAQAAYPQAKIRRVTTPFRPGAPYGVYLQQPFDVDFEGGTVVYLDGRGTVVGAVDGRSLPLGRRVLGALLGIHAGAWGGGPGRTLTGLIGLGLMTLGLLGAWSFLRGPRMRRRAG